MKHLLTSALIVTGLLGCATAPSDLQQDRSYVLEWIGERPLLDDSHLSMTLGSDGRAYGNAGCNHWFAAYTLDGGRLSFGSVGSTRKLCAPALMEQEKRFLQALGKPTASRCACGLKRADQAARYPRGLAWRDRSAPRSHRPCQCQPCFRALILAFKPSSVCSPSNCSRTLPLSSMM